MSLPDLGNAIFEGGGIVFLALNIKRLYKDKLVRGQDWRALAFFTFWGYWNLLYYPHLEQWWSFTAGIGIAITNTIYLSLMLYYISKESTI